MPPSKSDEPKSKPGKGKVTAIRLVDETDAPPKGPAPGTALKLKDLVDIVAATGGGKKAEVRKTVEATLAALGKALAAGSPANLPGFGKLRVVKNNGNVLTLKLRMADEPKAAGLALADDGEDD